MRAIAIGCVTGAIVLAGCGGPSQEEQVRDALTSFGSAVATKDYKKLCDQLLAAELVRKVTAAGLACEDALSRGLGSVQKPTLEVVSVKVRSDRLAIARVRTGAANQRASTDTFRVVREKGAWRVGSLSAGGPSAAPQPGAPQPGSPQPGVPQPGPAQPGPAPPGQPQPGATGPAAPGATQPGATQPGSP